MDNTDESITEKGQIDGQAVVDERTLLMLEYAPFVVMLWDENLQLLDCNQEAVRIFGLSSKKEYMERFFELAPEYQPNGMTTQELFLKAHALIFKETEFARIEWVQNHGVTGEAIPFEITLVRIKYKGRYAAVSYGHDLRKRYAAVAKAREADERAQIIFDTAPLASCMFDKDFIMFDCNQETVKMFELPDKEFYIKRFSELFPEYQPSGELSAEKSLVHIRIALEKGYHRFEWMYQKMDGEPVPTEVTLVRVGYRGEDVVAAYIRDLREQRAKEQLTKLVMEKTSTLTAILDSTPDLIFCKDLHFVNTECNKAMVNFFNLPKERIIGKDDSEAFGWSAEKAVTHLAVDKKVFSEGQAVTVEEYIPASDGTLTVFETIKTPLIQDGNLAGLVGMARDVTRRKAAEEEAKKAFAEAEAASVEAINASLAKSRFIANMSHEMRTPMNVIVGLTDLMLEEEDGVSDKVREELRKINTAGNTLMGLINDILDISKIEAGRQELNPSEYDVASFLNDIITLNIVRIGEKPITFKLDIGENLPQTLFGDDLRVKQVLNNLLSNAFKYTEQGTVTLGVECDIPTDSPLLVTFSISDTGMGIHEEDIKKLFSDYNQVDTKANRKIEGTGLGLSITKKFVEMMGGEITVESEYGKGTTFRASIRQGFVTDTPIAKETVENLRNFRYTDKKKQAQGKIARADLSYVHVLVVDDFPMNLDVAAGMLRKYKMQVDCASSGQEAVDRIQAGEPVYNAVFMDHMMPGMDGVEATKLIRGLGTEYAKELPVIALTANAVSGSEQMFLENGFNAFLPKPFNAMLLDSVIKRWIGKK